jgi:predicted nucleotidyltransferase
MTKSSRYLEGDYVRTREGLYFAVKGSRHPDDKVIAYLRYKPDSNGDREKDGVRYLRMYSIEETTRFLKENYPKYVNKVEWLNDELQSIPIEDIETVFKPHTRLIEIIEAPETRLEYRVKRFVETLSNESHVPTDFFGVSGSILIGLDKPESDIDINIYGQSEGRKVYYSLKRLRENLDWINAYDKETVQEVLHSRWGGTGISLNKFIKTEVHKILHGRVEDTDYFIRLIKPEPNKSTIIQREETKIRGVISCSTNSIYTPCSYLINEVEAQDNQSDYPIIELKSYRGKFTEQATKGDYVEARGRVEQVKSDEGIFYRLMLEEKGDYLLPVEDLL